MKIEEVKNLLYEFWQRSSDACPLEAGEAEQQESSFADFVEEKIKAMTFSDASTYMMKYLSEKHHPHMMAEIESNKAILWEGDRTYHDNSYLVD